MRDLHDHKTNSLNDKLRVIAVDDPGIGGASHLYQIVLPDGSEAGELLGEVSFQNGPIAENGINGVTQETLLAIVVDRLRAFQEGDYRCRENALAITHLEEAQHWLAHRTNDRLRRGVEGTMNK